MSTLVSILTPSFNQARWLEDNLRSVRKQSFGNIEHLVMDGGSSDGTLEILRSTDGNVSWISEPDRGQSHALNKAFAESQGEYIGWLNSDDAYADVRAVESAVDKFRSDPSVGVVYGHSLLVSQSNRVMQYCWAPAHAQKLIGLQTLFTQPAVFLRRSVLDTVLVDEDLHYVMDRDLWWRLADRTRFARIDLVVGVDRYQPARKTLQAGYPAEVSLYESDRGVDNSKPLRLAIRKGLKTTARFLGAYGAARGDRSIQPAIALRWDGTAKRLINQTVLPRKYMNND